MKRINIVYILAAGLFSMLISSCRNQDIKFPDYDYSTVYFAYQYPVRTIVLGEDIYDTSLDNQHKCMIYATMGGVYSNDQKIAIDVAVDNALTNNLFFAASNPVQAMPSNYYQLASNQILLDKSQQGGVEVQLSDAFFADKNSLKNSYVIPLRMTKVVNADSILSGKPKYSGAVRGNTADWDVLPKDYVLYCVKFINQWHASYLRRGVDQITNNGTSSTAIRHKQYVENDEISSLKTASLMTNEFPVSVVNATGDKQTCTLLLTFDSSNKITVSTTTEGFTATGTGTFVPKGEKKSWGNKDRDAIYLNYNITSGTGVAYATKDTLVAKDRGVKLETFNPLYLK